MERPQPHPEGELDGGSVIGHPENAVEHREDVVRRLLQRGLSPTALRAMLPTFEDVIARVVAEAQPEKRTP